MQQAQQDWVDLRYDPASGIETIRAHFTGHAYDPHWHDTYLIGVTEQGVQEFKCRRQQQVCTPGSTYLLEPGELHDGDARHQGGFTYQLLYLPTYWLNTNLAQLFAHLPDNYEFQVEQTIATDQRLMQRVSQAFSALHYQQDRLLGETCLDAMLAAMTRHCQWRSDNDSSRNQSLPLARQAREYLHAHVYQDISVQDLASALQCDRFRLNRSFQQAFAMSPHTYLIQLRLNVARQLLRQGNSPASVAAQLCFADQSHLGRWFKRAYRLTPSVYQRQIRSAI